MTVKRNKIFTMICIFCFFSILLPLSAEEISETDLNEKSTDINKKIDKDQERSMQMGDLAKPLSGLWVKGKPVDLSKPDGRTIHVIEFWETGCSYCLEAIPVLNEVQKKFKNIRIIGVTEEPEEQVRDFLKDTNLEYSVLCADKTVISSYFGVNYGVPKIFIVNKDGIVSWSGHPKHRFESVLDKIVKGTYDIKNEQKIEQKETELSGLFQEFSSEKEILKKVEELITLDPYYFEYYTYKLELLEKLNEPVQLTKFHQLIYSNFKDSPEDLASLTELLTSRPFEFVNFDIALKSIKRAVELSERKNARALLVNARFLFNLGLVNDACTILKEAMLLDSNYYEELVYTFDFYEKVKAAGDKIKNIK